MKILKGGRLIDGTGAAPVDGATIVLRDNRIASVTSRNQSDWPADAEIIDVSGKTVLPGLIDCHDHMANHRYSLEHRWRLDEPQSTRHLRTAAVLKQTLAAGYTMIRDAAGLDVGFKRAMRIADMSPSNAWAGFSNVFRRTREAYLEHEKAKAELKGLMPEDAKEAVGHGIRAKRSKSGAVSFDVLSTEGTAHAPLQ